MKLATYVRTPITPPTTHEVLGPSDRFDGLDKTRCGRTILTRGWTRRDGELDEVGCKLCQHSNEVAQRRALARINEDWRLARW